MNAPRVVLVRTKEPANIGAAARAMLNFGLRDLWLVSPRGRINERAHALASHAAGLLDAAVIVDSLEAAVADREAVYGTSARGRAERNIITHTPRSAAPHLNGNAAIVFGPEDHGLSNEELARCQAQIVIPTRDYSSLNLAQAVLLTAYEWSSAQGSQPGGEPKTDPYQQSAGARGLLPREHELAERSQVEGYYEQLSETLLYIGYTDPARLPSVMRIFRRFTDRAQPSAHELAAMRGLLRQAIWAADQHPNQFPGNRNAANADKENARNEERE